MGEGKKKYKYDIVADQIFRRNKEGQMEGGRQTSS